MTSTTNWKPARTLQETRDVLTAPGTPFEMEHALVGGTIQRVYKNVPKSMREFYLGINLAFKDEISLVFEKERHTFAQVFAKANRAASVFREFYGVHKGMRVGLALRNYPEWIIAFWAINLLGAVPVLVNALLPAKVIRYCLVHTECKLIILDGERADLLHSHLGAIRAECGATGIIVARANEARKRLIEGRAWESVMAKYEGQDDRAWAKEVDCSPEDYATIYFTSGTTGMPKGVLSTQRAAISGVINIFSNTAHAAVRRGEPIPGPQPIQRAALLTVPLFHVTGCIGYLLSTTAVGGKVVLVRKWDTAEATRLIVEEKITSAGGVPSMVQDLLETDLNKQDHILEQMAFGGAPPPSQLPGHVQKTLAAKVATSQGYGLTETNAAIASFCAEDYLERPGSTGRPCPINDILIMDPKTNKEVPVGQDGEVWMRGPNIMVGYWKNPKATAKVLTKDGWFNSEDIGMVDKDGFLYIKGRVKDLIVRGGENIDPVSVENAMYEDERVLHCAAVAVPDKRLGEIVGAVVYPKHGVKVTEEEIIALAKEHLPAFAVPVIVVVSEEPFLFNAAGKIMKPPLQARAVKEWERRRIAKSKAKL